VFRSVAHIYAQVIDDTQRAPRWWRLRPSMRKGKRPTAATWPAAKEIGKLVAERAKEKGIKGGVRSRRLSLSRPREGAGRRGAGSGTGVLMAAKYRKTHRSAVLNLKEQVVAINRVTKVVKGGKN
jgi:ribosomal protein L18